MSFKNNGNKRDYKYVLSSIFLLIVAIVCLTFALSKSGSSALTWYIITAATGYVAVAMFRNANE